MDKAFQQLRKAICDPGERTSIRQEDLESFAENCVVALAVGGHSSRMQSITDELGVNKNALKLPNGDTMLESTIRMYRDAGFNNFLALVAHQADSIIELLGDGTESGVQMSYSHDPGGPVGRGGAVRNALENGSIPKSHNLIVHNPDDIILDYPGSFPHDLVAAHIAGQAKRMLATAVMAEGLPATYTGMRVQDGVVEEVVSYPRLPVPAHAGITVFSPSIYPLFEEHFGPGVRSDFESVLFPVLVSRRKLYTMFIPSECWLQVNDPKAWNKLVNSMAM